jgi:putative membrane protein
LEAVEAAEISKKDQTAMMSGYYGWMGGTFGGVGMVLGMLVWLALLALLVWGISSLFMRRPAHTQAEALEILRRRYAAGEITSAEFETARRALS